MKCRHCCKPLEHVFLDLGAMPPSNSYTTLKNYYDEHSFPLKVLVCDNCWLVQTEDFLEANKIFTEDYAYYSSMSKDWLDHAERYCKKIKDRLFLTPRSFVVEIGCNDGYLLKNFIEMGVPCLGIEPSKGTAEIAKEKGIPVLCEFFTEGLGSIISALDRKADLICGNNVYAHVPDINNFTRGLTCLLKKEGTITLEFPHLLNLICGNQFDTVYHEHFSYLSLNTVINIFQAAGLRIYDVEELPTHGGSLRIYGCHIESHYKTKQIVSDIVNREIAFGLGDLKTYQEFQPRIDRITQNFISALVLKKSFGHRISACGAAAKGNTLLNYARIGKELIDFVCDSTPFKQGKYLPGSHIPIVGIEILKEKQPDWVVILPWNVKKEIMQWCLDSGWQGKGFITAIPELEIVNVVSTDTQSAS